MNELESYHQTYEEELKYVFIIKSRDEQLFEAFTLAKLKEKHSVEVNSLKEELKMKTGMIVEL